MKITRKIKWQENEIRKVWCVLKEFQRENGEALIYLVWLLPASTGHTTITFTALTSALLAGSVKCFWHAQSSGTHLTFDGTDVKFGRHTQVKCHLALTGAHEAITGKSPQFSWNSAESMLGFGTAGPSIGLCYKKVTHDPGALILCEKDVKVTSKMVENNLSLEK